MATRVGFDVGGTFTDVAFFDASGDLVVAKLPSELHRVGSDIVALIGMTNGQGTPLYVHASTVASNAIIEGRTPAIALVTTEGFRDTLEMRGQRRPDVYDVDWERASPLVKRELRFEIPERILADGRIDRPIDLAASADVITQLLRRSPAAVAVCFVNAYANPVHEEAFAQLLRERDLNIAISISSVVRSEIGEYERTSTTSVNALLMPVIADYLGRIQPQLDCDDDQLLIMQSNGGLMSAKTARLRPVNLISSGPAAGILAASRLAQEAGLERVLCLDMGGTTAKASVIQGGIPAERSGTEIGGVVNFGGRLFGGGGHVVRVASLDIVEVGAGGGSIAWIDQGGGLRVGPRGAGASPGPACYGRGGTEPTVTDAHVVLGYINPSALAGGRVAIDPALARESIERRIATPLGIPLRAAALGIIQVADATMKRALQAASLERGHDPRTLTLIAYGGAGPLHAARLADSLGVSRVFVPPFPGVFSALGLLLANYRHDAKRSLYQPVERLDLATIRGNFRSLEGELAATLRSESVVGAHFHRQLDAQYRNQDSPLTLPFPSGRTEPQLRKQVHAAFQIEHERVFGFSRHDPIDIVGIRVQATADAAGVGEGQLPKQLRRGDTQKGDLTKRRAYFGGGATLVARVYSWNGLISRVPGPAMVDGDDATILVPPEWSVEPHPTGSLVMQRSGPGNLAKHLR